jgi:hypothetical protein
MSQIVIPDVPEDRGQKTEGRKRKALHHKGTKINTKGHKEDTRPEKS